MNLWGIVKAVGTGALTAAIGPAAPLVIGAINAALPDEAKLPENATGAQAQDALATIPAPERAALMDKEFDVEIAQIKESHDTVRTMLEQDAANPQSTRPYIAKGSFHVVAFVSVMTVSLWGFGILKADTKMVETIVNGWPFLLAAIGPLVVLLHAYFGVLRQEQKQKLDAAGGMSQPSGIAGLLTGLLSRK